MLPKATPTHVTLRVRPGIPSLRKRRFVEVLRASLRRACERKGFRVCHYSIQRDHVHLVIEAEDKRALGRGMKSVAARLARAVQRVFGRSGPVLHGRYHLRVLGTPREVRNAIAYVLLNIRKHWRKLHRTPPPARIDEASSAAWFDGWEQRPRAPDIGPVGVAAPRFWLLTTGWRRHGLIDFAEVPSGASPGR
jgi:REP element-mobilizing transposase RayT